MRRLRCTVIPGSARLLAAQAFAGQYVLTVKGNQIVLNERPVKILGLRCSNTLISDEKTDELIANLDGFKSYGVNTISVFLMGSRFGDVKGYRPDASLDPTYASRLGRIIGAADRRGMIVRVGCLYWSKSTAKSDLGRWQQTDADKAIGNTIRWLKDHNYRNVFVDLDNEGMAHQATRWSISQMIDAAHAVASTIMIAYNDRDLVPGERRSLHSPQPEGQRQTLARQRSHSDQRPGWLLEHIQQRDQCKNGRHILQLLADRALHAGNEEQPV